MKIKNNKTSWIIIINWTNGQKQTSVFILPFIDAHKHTHTLKNKNLHEGTTTPGERRVPALLFKIENNIPLNIIYLKFLDGIMIFYPLNIFNFE